MRVRRGDLIHYSYGALGPIRSVAQRPESADVAWYPYEKPRGLWVSVLGRNDWASWCRSESFRATRQQHASRINLRPDARVLRMASAYELDAFTRQYGEEAPGSRYIRIGINWRRVAEDYRGIIIAPYVWSRRLHDATSWYYGWDCASGCIWDKCAIDSVESIRSPELATA